METSCKKLFLQLKLNMKLLTALLLCFSIEAFSFELVAHRGVHQTYSRKNLDNRTCTATRIDRPKHTYLENTLRSIEAAFDFGADIVELDIHPTKENGGGSKLVVFHDWTLDCRTNSQCKGEACVTHNNSMTYLKSLDAGFGYTHDGKNFPFRAKYIGAIPDFEEVLGLLARYPSKKILVNQKDQSEHTVNTFLRITKNYPEGIRKRIHFPRYFKAKELNSLGVPDAIYQSGKAKKCFKKYVLKGWFGRIPEACKNISFFVPQRETLKRLSSKLPAWPVTSVLWGWPDKFIERMHSVGSKVYISQVDSIEDLQKYNDFKFDGIMTNRIELIGPYIKMQN